MSNQKAVNRIHKIFSIIGKPDQVVKTLFVDEDAYNKHFADDHSREVFNTMFICVAEKLLTEYEELKQPL